jgi:hypothetical protein
MNTDSVPLNPPTDIPWLSFGGQDDSTCPFKLSEMKNLFKLDCDNKNENVKNNKGEMDVRTRLTDFCRWVHNKLQADRDITDLVITGHSMWIRQFFRMNAPKKTDETAQNMGDSKLKLTNNAIVQFDLTVGPNDCEIPKGKTYIIDGELTKRLPLSMEFVFRNSEGKASQPSDGRDGSHLGDRYYEEDE